MSTLPGPPRPTYHLRTFAVCLALVVCCLAGFLFGVRLEAVAPATGVIVARDQQEIRARLGGLVEPGWYESHVPRRDGSRLVVRLDGHGNGGNDPSGGPAQAVRRLQLADGSTLLREELRFHHLQPGDELWPGQVLATVYPVTVPGERQPAGDQAPSRPVIPSPLSFGLPAGEQDGSDQAVLRAPPSAERWLVLDVRVAPFQAVRAGKVIATLAPLDVHTRQPRDLVARLDIDEKHLGPVTTGQTVHLYSNVYNHRLQGCAEARIERLEPWGKAAADGSRRFHAVAAVTHAPFPLPLGSTCKAEIVVGRKLVYRIILEH
jgi:hypothetical protein